MDKRIEKYMPSYVHLYYVDYHDNLRDNTDLLQSCITKNNLYPLSENVFDFWDYPECYYYEEIRKAMREDGIEDLFDELRDEIDEYLYEHDDSDPVRDLLQNTGDVTCFYDLGVEVDCGWHETVFRTPWRNETVASCAYKVRRKLGIQKGTPEAEQIYNICANATCGGTLRLYFKADVESLISGDNYLNAEDKQDFQQIRFKGKVAVAVYNPNQGAGDFDYIDIDCTLPFLRDNLAISKVDKYHLEDCFGMCGDWLNKCVTPILSVEPLKKKKTLKKSKISEDRKREAEYDAVFKAGGCTPGDMDITRHRDVYYDNTFPCGMRCPLVELFG